MEKEPNLNSAEKPRKLNSREFFEEKKKKKSLNPPPPNQHDIAPHKIAICTID